MIGFEYICKLFDIQYKDVAEKLKISKQTVNSWTSGRRKIPQKYLPILSKRFNIPEEYLQKKLENIDKMKIQRIKLDNELDSDILNKSFKEAGQNDRDILRKLSIIDIKIKRSELLEELKKILAFENINDRVFINTNLMYLKSVIKIIESDNFYEIAMADTILTLVLYYYEPDKYKKDIDTSGLDSESKKINDNFNKSILKSISDFLKQKEEIELKDFDNS